MPSVSIFVPEFNLLSGNIQNMLAELADQPERFQDGDEDIRTDGSLLRMLPAAEGFKAFNFACDQRDDRLVDDVELVTFECRPDIVLQGRRAAAMTCISGS